MNARYLAARGYDCLMMGVRAYQRFLPSIRTAGRRRLPVFKVESGGIALTIDDGPHPEWTPPMLDLLAQHEVKATFFLIGGNVARYPALARRVAEAGHAIGNHSMSHPQPFGALSTMELRAEVRDAQHAIEDAIGSRPKLFRSPGGGWSPAVARTVAAYDLTMVDWTVNPSDWKRPGTSSIHTSLSRARSSHVLLCHDGGGDRSQTVAALTSVIPTLSQRGLRFVTPAATSEGRSHG